MASNERVALVTGAGSGVGRCCAHALLEEGYSVVLAGRREELLDETAAEAGPRALVVRTDVRDPNAVRDLFLQTQSTFGRLDVLFNNAGINIQSVMEELSFEQWKSVLDTNLTGFFLCTQEAFKLMKNQKPHGGRIINNGSISAHSPRPNSVAYTATKHGITGLTKQTSLDGREFDIACGQIDIGNAETSLMSELSEGVPQANGSIAVEPSMSLDTVARAVVFMAGLPLEENVQFLTVMATKMPYLARG